MFIVFFLFYISLWKYFLALFLPYVEVKKILEVYSSPKLAIINAALKKKFSVVYNSVPSFSSPYTLLYRFKNLPELKIHYKLFLGN